MRQIHSFYGRKAIAAVHRRRGVQDGGDGDQDPSSSTLALTGTPSTQKAKAPTALPAPGVVTLIPTRIGSMRHTQRAHHRQEPNPQGTVTLNAVVFRQDPATECS